MKKAITTAMGLFFSVAFSAFVWADGGWEPLAASLTATSYDPVIEGTFTARYKLDNNNSKGYHIFAKLCMKQFIDDKEVEVCRVFAFDHDKITQNKWLNDFAETELIKSYQTHVSSEAVLARFGLDDEAIRCKADQYQGQKHWRRSGRLQKWICRGNCDVKGD